MTSAVGLREPEATTLDELADLRPRSRPLRVVLLGEFSAGKSSVINLLVGSDLIPTGVLATTRRLIKLHHAERIQLAAIDGAGRRRELEPSLTAQFNGAAGHFEIGLPCARLAGMELVDTPGLADPNRDPADTLAAAAECDVAIWCTRAHQAWRHSEQIIWSSLPAHLRENGLLVVTRSDKLDRASDRRSVMARLRQEAGALFHDIVLLSTLKAQQAQGKNPGELDVALWKRSGGEALASGLLQSLSRAVRRALPGQADHTDQPSEEMHSSGDGPGPAERPIAIVVAPEQEVDAEGADAVPEDTEHALPEEAKEDQEPAVIEREIVVGGASDIDPLLCDLVRAIDGCRIAACIDLERTQPLAVAHDVATRPQAIGAQLAALAAALFAGPATQPIRDSIAAVDGGSSPADGAIDGITIDRGDSAYVFWRRTDRPDQAVVLAATGGTSLIASLGLIQVKIRQLPTMSREVA